MSLDWHKDGEAGMTELYFDYWMWRCKNCKQPIVLPGIAPSIKTLQDFEWKFCPGCGEMIDYQKTQEGSEAVKLDG